MMVSVIIPVYNCERYISACIRSVCEQTYKDIEIIIIDDGSTDGSGMLIDGFTDERIRAFHTLNQGVCAARNLGLDRAAGDYITFVDADDHIDPDYIDRMLKEAEGHDSELVISGFIIEEADGSLCKYMIPGQYVRNEDEMWAYRLSAAAGRLYRKALWDRLDIRYTSQKGVRGEDVPICLLTNYAAGNIRVLKYAGYHYIQHAGSAMQQYVGLKKYGFPYEAMDELAEKIQAIDEHNSREFYETGVIKLFAQFYFYMGRGADKKLKQEMLVRFKKYLEGNCPGYRNSWRYVKRASKMPLTIWGAIELFVLRLMI